MKLSTSLLQAITFGVALAVVSTACHRDEVKSGGEKSVNTKKHKQDKSPKGCPACGMG